MFAALLKGMLSTEQENMEDLLTSSVFGVFQFSSLSDSIIRFLQISEPMYGDNPLKYANNTLQVHFDSYEFWPKWSGLQGVDNCEPDLVIEIHNSLGKNILVLIEAKFNSTKSSFPTEDGNISDQLAKEWVHLYRHARKRSCIPWLVYLTADTATPEYDIEESKKELEDKISSSDVLMKLNISWLTWRHLSHIFRGSNVKQLSQLTQLANRLGLTFYTGFRRIRRPPPFVYRFDTRLK